MTDTINVPDGINGMEAPKPAASLIFVTPEMAQRWLPLNKRNRNLRVRAISMYAADMRAGNWQITGEAIKFDRNGLVLDGQHRLLAIIESGMTVPMFVIRGLDPAAQDVMDTGLKRTASDALSLNGFKHSSALAASSRLAINYEAGYLKTAVTSFFPAVTNAQVIEYVTKNPDVEYAVAHTNGMRSTVKANQSSLAFSFLLINRIDGEQAHQFFADLHELRTAGAGDPRHTLLRRFALAKDRGEHLGPVTESHYIFRAWNAMRSGESLQVLKTGNSFGPFAFTVPV